MSDEAEIITSAEKSIGAIEIIVRALVPLSSDERRKAVDAALVILGEPVSPAGLVRRSSALPADDDIEVNSNAKLWIKQHIVDLHQLSELFHIEGNVAQLIAPNVTGKSNSQKVYNAYLLVGVGKLLSTGAPEFNDDDAREACRQLGIYDRTNHSKYVKEFGNSIIGSKAKGWKLTAPGLKAAAEFVNATAT